MKLLTKDIERRLKDNAAFRRGQDLKPVVKFFTPWGAATWLFTELDEDGDTLFGLCDLGFGFPELGYASLAELRTLRGPGPFFSLGVERDLHFKADKTLTEYADEASNKGRIAA